MLAVAFAVYRKAVLDVEMQRSGELIGQRWLCLGSTKGIGLGVARYAAARGAHVTIVGRDVGDALAQLDEIGGEGKAQFMKADLSLVRNARAVVRDYLATSGGQLDVLVLTAGIATMQGFTPTSGERLL